MANKGKNPGQRQAPSLMLMALVSQFLMNNGFNSSARIFNTERKKRPKKEGWMGSLAKNYTADFPALEKIFAQWESDHMEEYKKDQAAESSSSSSDTDTDVAATTQSSSSDSATDELAKVPGSEHDVDMGDAEPVDSSSSEASDASSSSESESESASDNVQAAKDGVKNTVASPKKSLKRKAVDTSSESSDSSESTDGTSSSEDDSSSSDSDEPPAKKVRRQSSTSDSDSDGSSESASESDSSSASDELEVVANIELPSSASSNTSSSSEDSDADSESEDSSADEDEVKPTTVKSLNGMASLEEASSDSSGTIVGDTESSALAVASRNGGHPVNTDAATEKVLRKHAGAHPTRLAQMSANANLADFVSNDYVSYDYADKAYRDLVVTRGKGFTKEKNKKKRGSYRGGAIDISGGKGFKFDD